VSNVSSLFYTEFIKLKEENIFFSEEFLTEELVRGIKCKVFHATLT